MIRSPRVAGWCLLGLVAMSAAARAADVPRTAPPADKVDVEDRHRFSPLVQGLVGGAAGVALGAGIGLLADSYVHYDLIDSGGDGNSCRPCSASQLARPRGEYGAGIGLLAVSGVLAITAGVLGALDTRYRHQRESKLVSALELGGVRF